MSGCVARLVGGISFNSNEIEFLMDKKNQRKEKIFPSRESAIEFLRKEKHFAVDDLLYMFWFEDGEDIKRNLWTGESVEKGGDNGITDI